MMIGFYKNAEINATNGHGFNGKWKKKKEMKKKCDGKSTCDTLPRLIILFRNEKSHEQNKLEEGRDFYVLSNANNNNKKALFAFSFLLQHFHLVCVSRINCVVCSAVMSHIEGI